MVPIPKRSRIPVRETAVPSRKSQRRVHLKRGEPDIDDWTKAWDSVAAQQEERAADDLRRGFARSAGARLLRASTYYLTGERQTPLGPAKTNSYQRALQAFGQAVKYLPEKPERVEVSSPDGLLPGWLIPSAQAMSVRR